MVTPIDPSSAAFLMAESRAMPMHVGGLQLFSKPEGAGRNYSADLYDAMRTVDEMAPLFLRRPHRSVSTAGQWTWVQDEMFDIDYHVRHSALPKPGRIRELLDLCSRLHGTPLGRERPLWEVHVIEGLRDGRVAMYQKIHHSLVDGVAAMRLLQTMLSPDPEMRDMPAPWAKKPPVERPKPDGELGLPQVGASALRSALAIASDAAGMPSALVRTLNAGIRNETSALSLHAPRTMFNQTITGARRFAAQDFEIARMQAIGKASGTTINDVVLAMCSGAVRKYLIELDALPETSLVSMVPIGLNAKQSQTASADGGNAIGSVMVRMGTELDDPLDRLLAVKKSMEEGKAALSSMTPTQIVAMSALGMAPSLLIPMLRMQGIIRPPFNLIISNVPGPRQPLYMNGARLEGMYPLSIPIHGMALNITCASYNGQMGFGLTGCRRTVPHLQRLLSHLEDEMSALENAVGI